MGNRVRIASTYQIIWIKPCMRISMHALGIILVMLYKYSIYSTDKAKEVLKNIRKMRNELLQDDSEAKVYYSYTPGGR